MRVQTLSPPEWLALQPTLRPLVESALTHAQADWTYQSVTDHVLRGEVIPFACFDGPKPAAVLIGQFIYYPGKKVFLILFCAGGFRGYAPALQQIFEFARAAGAVTVEAWCRPSITRLLRAFNFYKAYDVVRFDL